MTGPRKPVMAALLAEMQPLKPYTAAGLAKTIGCTRMAAYQALGRMAAKQQIGERVLGGGNVYFKTQADADLLDAEAASALATQLRIKRAENLETNKRRAMATAGRYSTVREKPSTPAPVVILEPAKIDRPVDMSRAVLTTVKTPACRFAVDPASIVPGAFVVDVPAGRWSDYALQRAPR